MYIMLKKFGIVTAITTAFVFGGALSSVDASASTSEADNPSYNVHHVGNEGDWNLGTLQQFDKQDDHTYGETDSHVKQEQTEAPKNDEAPNEQQASAKQNNQTEQQAEGLSEYEQEVVDLTNEEREKRGLSPLKADTELSEVAHEKSRDMSANNYFSHDSPNYGSPFDMMKTYGVSYQTAGENIARGQQSPEEVVDGWMNSEGHRENILNEDFTNIGVGYVEDGNYWTQEFTG